MTRCFGRKAEESGTLTWRGSLACATCIMAATTFLHLVGCSPKTAGIASAKSDGEQPQATGVQNSPSANATATIAAARGELVRPQQALVLQLQREPWQALAAACLTPAFYNSDYAMPLVLDDGAEKRKVAIAHDTASVAGFGGNAAAATAKIATTYWKKAPCVFVVETYEQSLWIVPSAAVVAAPILVKPDQATLAALAAKTAVVVGEGKPAASEVLNLAGKEDVWKFQLSLMAERGKSATTW